VACRDTPWSWAKEDSWVGLQLAGV
jgi:hypothetical protein